ncbi:MAG: hypothetical protein ACRDKT_08565, partial [Actinomycetota bacterium]
MTRIQGLDGMREAPPLNITALVEAARVKPKVVEVPPEPEYTGPKEGSAAWQAEQIAMGKAEIHTRAPSLDFSQGSFALGPSKKETWGAAMAEVWHRLRVARLIALVLGIALAGYVYITGGAPSAREVSNAFVEIPGYQYQTETDPQLDQATASLDDLPGFESGISALEARGVTHNGVLAGAVVIAGLDPSETTERNLARQVKRHIPSAHVVPLGRPGKNLTGYEFLVGSVVEVAF